MKRSRLVLVAGLAATALALGGCATNSEETPDDDASAAPSEEPSEQPSEAPEDEGGTAAVDTMFGEIEITLPADEDELRVVALGWSDAEVALALGVKPVATLDWMGFGEENKGVGSWAVDLWGDETPTVFSDTTALDYESIQLLEPDVILNTRSDNSEETYNRLSEIAPTVYGPEGSGAYATSWDVQTQLIADALGKSDEGAALVDEVTAQIDAAAADNPQFEGVTAVTGTKFGEAYGAYIAGDFRWDLIEALGFVQNPPVLELPTQGFYVDLSADNITALDAEVAVMFPIGFTLEEMKADALIGSLDVVKEDRTVFLDSTDEVAQAFSAASPLSIPVAVDGIVPQLAEIVK